MDFCVRCGSKQLYQDYLCNPCHRVIHPPRAPKGVRKMKPEPEPHHQGYFEATIQLRNVRTDIIQFLKERMREHQVHISKEYLHSRGVDYMIDDSRFAKKIGKVLQQKFGGMTKITGRIFTRERQTSKDIYRVTALFKQFPYAKGERFDFKGQDYTVIGVGPDVFVENAQTKERRHLRFKELEKARIF